MSTRTWPTSPILKGTHFLRPTWSYFQNSRFRIKARTLTHTAGALKSEVQATASASHRYVHIAALTGVKCLALVSAAAGAAATPTVVKLAPKAAPAPPPAPAPKVAPPTPAAKAAPAPAPKKEPTPAPAPAPTEKPKDAEEEEDDVDDWFAEDDDEEDDKPKPVNEALEKAKAAAMEKLAKKEAKQRSLCALEIKPCVPSYTPPSIDHIANCRWSTEQDLIALFKKVKEKVVKDGLVWYVVINALTRLVGATGHKTASSSLSRLV